jgi:hypothetical protein
MNSFQEFLGRIRWQVVEQIAAHQVSQLRLRVLAAKQMNRIYGEMRRRAVSITAMARRITANRRQQHLQATFRE